MNNLIVYIVILTSIFPLFACQKIERNTVDIDNKTYINKFELIRKNSSNNIRINITSPKAIIDPINNIEIFDSLIHISNKNGSDIKIKSGNSILNNQKSIVTAYNNVTISLLDNVYSFIATNSFDWDLNTPNIIFTNPLKINFLNTNIISSNGNYNIELGHLKLNNNIFTRNILNKYGETIYQIRIVSDNAKWLKDNNLLEFTSNKKQVETTINFLGIK